MTDSKRFPAAPLSSAGGTARHPRDRPRAHHASSRRSNCKAGVTRWTPNPLPMLRTSPFATMRAVIQEEADQGKSSEQAFLVSTTERLQQNGLPCVANREVSSKKAGTERHCPSRHAKTRHHRQGGHTEPERQPSKRTRGTGASGARYAPARTGCQERQARTFQIASTKTMSANSAERPNAS